MCSLKEHVFLVAGHKVASAIFFDGHRFLIVIKFYDDPKDPCLLYTSDAADDL